MGREAGVGWVEFFTRPNNVRQAFEVVGSRKMLDPNLRIAGMDQQAAGFA